MRVSKLIFPACLLLLTLLMVYSAFMYVYTENMFAPVSLLTPVQVTDTYPPALEGYTRFIHQVNTPQRARQKDRYFAGFEVDVWRQADQFLAAHDPRQAVAQIALTDIFASVKNPAEKWWWLDLKQELSASELDQLVALAAQYNIPKTHILFEASAGPTAAEIAARGYLLLLQLPDGFNDDRGNPARRAELNRQLLLLWQKYKPAAISASFGKYTTLRAYFPTLPKAIYYSATVRPSLKKYLMSRRMQKDSSVKIFMTEEYTYLPF